MSLKDEIASDLDNVFLNIEEFAENHLVEGKEILCVLDNDSLKRRQGSAEIGIDESTLLLFAKVDDLPKKQKGGLINIDHKEYIIDDWKVNFGMAEIVLQRNVSAY